jgi:hypothetical protein
MVEKRVRLRAAGVLLGALWCAAGASGCRVSKDDVHRWELTERGPLKLVAVITHDKYPWDLRVEAAMSLIRMSPRGGVRQGIKILCDHYKDDDGEDRPGALVQLSEEARAKIVGGMAPELIAEMQKPPPQRTADNRLPPDPSVPYKDAAFAMLSHEPPLVSEEQVAKQLRDALTQWAQTGFEDRIENSSQQFGIEQMMRFLGAPSVKALPGLINENTYRLDRIASLVADLGDAETKQKASEALVTLAKRVESQAWFDAQKPIVDEANKKAGVNNATPEQVATQITKMQDRRLTEEIFPAMKRVGGRPVVDYLFGVAGDPKGKEERRKLALAALEGRVDKANPADLERAFAIARDDSTPDSVRDVAFARLGEFNKDQILPKLYTLFEPKKWKVRWVAASLVLKTIGTKQVPDFMARMPKTPAQKMGMTEPLSYGQIIGKMEPPAGEPKPRDAIMPYLQSRELGPKLVALGYFYEGKAADVPVVKPHEGDPTPLPKCEKEDECDWKCDVPKPGSQEKESKELKTVGEFVTFCLIPSMEKK